MHRADSIGTSSGFLKARGLVDFGTVDILTATPNPFNAKQASLSGGGLGLLPWYIHPASADNVMTHAVAAGNATSALGTVKGLSVLTSSGCSHRRPRVCTQYIFSPASEHGDT